MNTSSFKTKAQFENGTMFESGEDMLYVLQLNGSWYEMGKQYGNLSKTHMQAMYDRVVQPIFDQGLILRKKAYELFGTRIFDTLSLRRKQYYQGVADGLGWTVEKVLVLDQSGPMGIYIGQLHSFSGCSSLVTWGRNTVDGHTILGRNMDWCEAFLDFPIYVTVYNPTDGSNSLVNVSWPGWQWMMTGFNDKGVYTDHHDGTAMGGNVISTEKPSFLNTVFDYMADSNSASALSAHFQAARTDIASIWMLADKHGYTCAYENTMQENRKRLANYQSDSLVTVNTFLNPDWGLGLRETPSFSLKRYDNLSALHAKRAGSINVSTMRDIFDVPLFDEDGEFKDHGGVTKLHNQDTNVTNYQVVVDLNELQMWVKLPALSPDSHWVHIDVRQLFLGQKYHHEPLATNQILSVEC
ncbi:C45 family autoproteolytic acyltransferase/hydrolase [Vibrio parahaemolyticus]|uniref:C45 family autoproteolytic acyltransferase/hydolase n=1 Tax=Vibrio mediterranei TaxID=689 RepID=UPI0040692AD8